MRAVPILVLLAVPFVLAAPVPKRPLVPVTSYSSAELAKLPFVDADELPAEAVGQGEGPKSGIVALAVTLPKTTFAVGEPIEPLFALKNRTDRALGLGFRLDFSDSTPNPWNDAHLEIRDVATRKRVGPGGKQLQAMIKGSAITVPEKGYYVASGDVGIGSDDKPLPAGEYELNWRYGWAKSNVVKFTVANRPHTGPTPFRSVRLIRVTESDGNGKQLEKMKGEAEVWESPGLMAVESSEAAAALGSGQFGRYFPSLRRLPESTSKLTTDVRWTSKDGSESFTLKLTAAEKSATATIPYSPFVYLLVECDAEEGMMHARQQAELEKQSDGRRIDTDNPYELTVRLPKDWTDHTDATGPARVAVLVSTVELHRDRDADQKELAKEVDSDSDWVVRTPWRELKLPKPAAETIRRDR